LFLIRENILLAVVVFTSGQFRKNNINLEERQSTELDVQIVN